MKLSCVYLLVAAVLATPGAAFFPQGLSRPSFFGGQNFWAQFQNGFDQLEEVATREAEQLDGAFQTMWATPDTTRDTEDSLEADLGPADLSSSMDLPGLSGGLFNIFNTGAMSRQPWWKGPNVCVEREEIDESVQQNGTDQDDEDGLFSSFQFSNCQQTDIKYVCTTKIRNHGIRKTFVVKYQCCYGSQRVYGKPGCTKVNLKSVIETASDLKATDFVQLVRSAGLEEKLSASNITVFAPSDDAVRDFTDSLEEANQVEFYVPPAATRRRRRNASPEGTSMRDIVLGHITPGLHDISSIVNEQVLYSDNANSTIRLNIYPWAGLRVITANCARLTSTNNYATNGIVHVVERVIRPVGKTLGQLIEQDDQFNTLTSLMKKADLLEMLEKPGHLTLFAPTDSAFEKLDPAVRNRLLAGEACVGNVMRHHLLPHMLCSAAFMRHVVTSNLAGNPLQLERRPEEDEKLFVSGVQVSVRDIVGTNGVIHVVDEVLMPDSANAISQALASRNLTTFLSLLQDAGLVESLDAMSNVTLFVPTEEALTEDPDVVSKLEALRQDKDKLRDLVMYHTTGPEVESCDLSNNQLLKTGLADSSIRVNLYATVPFLAGTISRATAQCARLVDFDNKVCGGVIHEVDRLLLPPTKSILDVVQSSDKYTVLRRTLEGTDLQDKLKEEGPFTFLAPTDEAFNGLEESDLKKLMEDKKFASSVLNQHVIPSALCCAGVGASSWPFTNHVEVLNGRNVPIRRDHENRIHIGSTTVTSCDKMATNGIVHGVNRVMVPQGHGHNGSLGKFGNGNVEVFLYGI